jgi:hypothetical protein
MSERKAATISTILPIEPPLAIPTTVGCKCVGPLG